MRGVMLPTQATPGATGQAWQTWRSAWSDAAAARTATTFPSRGRASTATGLFWQCPKLGPRASSGRQLVARGCSKLSGGEAGPLPSATGRVSTACVWCARASRLQGRRFRPLWLPRPTTSAAGSSTAACHWSRSSRATPTRRSRWEVISGRFCCVHGRDGALVPCLARYLVNPLPLYFVDSYTFSMGICLLSNFPLIIPGARRGCQQIYAADS